MALVPSRKLNEMSRRDSMQTRALGTNMSSLVTLRERSHVLASLAAAENEDDIDREPLEKAKQTRVATA